MKNLTRNGRLFVDEFSKQVFDFSYKVIAESLIKKFSLAFVQIIKKTYLFVCLVAILSFVVREFPASKHTNKVYRLHLITDPEFETILVK